MKIEDVHIVYSPLSRRIYLAVRDKRRKNAFVASQKVNRTEEFFGALFEFCPPGSSVEICEDDGKGKRYNVQMESVPEGEEPTNAS